MFTLQLDKSKFYKVKRGQQKEEITSSLDMPVGEIFTGQIIEVKSGYSQYAVKPLESYFDIAEKFSVSEKELRRINFNKILYPTVKIMIPPKNA